MELKKLFILPGIFCLYHSAVNAQFNDSTHYYLRYAMTGIVNKTNDVRSFILTNAVAFSVRRNKVELNSNTAWVYGQQGKALTNNDFSSVLNADLLRKVQRLYYWGLVNYTTSYSLKIDRQLQAGAGLGLTILNKPTLQLVISDGILYETSKLANDVQGDNKYQTFRNSLRLKFRCKLGNSVTFETTDFWQPSISSSEDYIIQSLSAIAVKIKSWLSVTATVNYNRFSRTDRENLLVNVGLVAERYF